MLWSSKNMKLEDLSTLRVSLLFVMSLSLQVEPTVVQEASTVTQHSHSTPLPVTTADLQVIPPQCQCQSHTAGREQLPGYPDHFQMWDFRDSRSSQLVLYSDKHIQ